MKIYYPIEVDLYHQYPLPKMNAQQNNIGRGALVTLTAAGAIIDPTGEAVTFWAKKPDGKVSFLPATQSGTQIQIEFTNQMLAVPGDVQVEIRMTGADNTDLSTPIFTVQVNPSNIKDGAVESQNEFSALQTFMAELAELKETGLKGDPGVAATIRVGKVTESEPGADPTVTNVGTEQAAVFDFTLPRGPAGPAGPEGGKELFFGARSTFPDAGDSKILYIDDTVDPALSYIWTGGKYVPAGGGGDVTAAEVEYDNKTSGLKSGTVQGAIDENAAGIKSLNSKIGNVELLRSATDSYNVTWSLYRIAGHIYQLVVEKRDQITHFPEGGIACPFTLEDAWKPTYSVLTSGITQSNTAFNIGASPSGVSGWSYGSFTGQLFCNLVWFG